MAVAAWEGQHDMFGSMFFGGSGTTGQPPRPGDASVRGMPIDVIEMTEEFDIRADIPGVSKGDIHLMVDNDVLSISVASKAVKQERAEGAPGAKVHRLERSQAFVRRSLRLPDHADLMHVTARYVDGVLLVTVPKAQEQERSRVVPVE